MGKSKAPKPSPQQNALAQAQADATYQQMALTQRMFDRYMNEIYPKEAARADEMWAFQRDLATSAEDRAKEMYNRYWDTTAKYQDRVYGLVDQYDAEAEGQRLAGKYATDIEAQTNAARGAMLRNLTARGWSPNSAALQSSMADAELEGALAKASAMTLAYEAAKEKGLNLTAMAAGLGGNLNAAQGADYMRIASTLGGEALDASGTQRASYTTGFGLNNQGQQVAIGWGNAANSTFDSINRANAARAQSGGGGIGGILGAIGGSMLGPFGQVAGTALGNWAVKKVS